MEHEDSLPCSQETATGPYPEPYESNLHPKTYLLKINFNIILPSTLRSSEWSLPFGLFNRNFVRFSSIPHARYMPHQSHLPLFYHPNNIWWRVQLCSSSLCNFLQRVFTSSLLGSNILLSTLFSNTLNLCSSLNVSCKDTWKYNLHNNFNVDPHFHHYENLKSQNFDIRFTHLINWRN
jgi:hypothetical protein